MMVRVFLTIILLLPLSFGGKPTKHHAVVARQTIAGGGFTAQTAVFDGTNDYMGTSTDPTGLADGKVFTASFWINLAGGDGNYHTIFYLGNGSDTRLAIFRDNADKIWVFGRNSSNTTILDLVSTNTITASSGWVHVYVCIDMANTSNRKIYFNGVSETLSVTTYTDDTLNLNNGVGPYRVGANGSAANLLNGTIAELWFNDEYYDDPTSFASGGSPIDLGTDGSTPTTNTPVWYFSRAGSGDTWAQNSGAAGDLTVTGALGTGTPP